MKRWLMVSLVAVALALMPTLAAADDGNGGGQGDGQQQEGGQQGDGQQGDGQHEDGQRNHFGPFSSASPDSGTCGPDWANDTFKREFSVRQTGPGTWRVVERFNDGRFVTLDSASPGACETSSPHGLLITAGKTGNFQGFLDGTVTGGTYNPNGCNAPLANCGTTSGFILAVFGPTAQYSCVTGVGACSFFFDYHARDQGLAFRHWVNASTDLGGNRGDIATT